MGTNKKYTESHWFPYFFGWRILLQPSKKNINHIHWAVCVTHHFGEEPNPPNQKKPGTPKTQKRPLPVMSPPSGNFLASAQFGRSHPVTTSIQAFKFIRCVFFASPVGSKQGRSVCKPPPTAERFVIPVGGGHGTFRTPGQQINGWEPRGGKFSVKHSSKLKGVPDMCLRGGEAEIFQAKFLESVLWKDLIF